MEHPFRTLTLTLAAGMTSAALAVAPAAPAVAQAHPQAPATQSAPTTEVVSTNLLHASFTQDGMHREYLVKLPENRDPARTYPVVLAFGGKGDSATSFRSYAGLEQATAGGAIIIYAQGVDNSWAGAPYASTTMAQDIAYVRTAVDDVTAHHGGDRGRVYAVGMSNGGGMATALGCHAPELVDATASVAGAYYDPTVTGCNPRGGVPALIIHGTNDTLMNYWGGTRHGAHYQGAYAAFESIAARNHCTVPAVNQVHEHPNSTTFRPAFCATPTEFVRIGDGGHEWSYTPSVADISWGFLQRQ